jgi:hypothetical protein
MSIPTAGEHAHPESQELFGRDAELEQLTRVVRSAPEGDRVVILTGEAGSGKSALLDAAALFARDAGQRVLQGAGSEFEADLAFAGLHQLLHPVLPEAGQLLESQRAALLGVVGLRPVVDVPKPMDVGIAVLTLLSDLAEHSPLTVVVDDAHWMDRASLDVVAFVARRLAEEQISLLIGVRAGEVLRGFDRLHPRVVLGPLDEGAAIRLVSADAPALTTWGREQIIGQAVGNPLALRELARAAAADPAVLEAGSAAGALPVSDRLGRIFAARLGELPDDARQAILNKVGEAPCQPVAGATCCGPLYVFNGARRALGRTGRRTGMAPREATADRKAAQHPPVVAAPVTAPQCSHPSDTGAETAGSGWSQRLQFVPA